MKTQLQHQYDVHPMTRSGIGLAFLLVVLFGLADIAGAQCTDLKVYQFKSGTGATSTAREGWDGGRVFATGQTRTTRNSLRLRYTSTYGNERTAGIEYDFGSLVVAKINLTYRSDFLSTENAFTVSCGKNAAQAKVVATLPGTKVGRKVTWITKEVTLTPAACGVSNDLGKVYVQLQNVATGTSIRYQDIDTIRFLSCPSITFADPTTKDPITGLTLNAGDSADVLVCLTDVGIAPSSITPVTLSESMASITLDKTTLNIPANNTCSSDTVKITRGATSPAETGDITATTTSYSSATLAIEPGIVFKDPSTGAVLTSLDIDEGTGKMVNVCLPATLTTATTVTLTQSATDSRINIQSSIVIQANSLCENLTISVSNNSEIDGTQNANGDSMDIDATGGGFSGTLSLSITDDEAPTGGSGTWSWKWDELMQMTPNGVVNGTIQTAGGTSWTLNGDTNSCGIDSALFTASGTLTALSPATGGTSGNYSVPANTVEIPVQYQFPSPIDQAAIGKRLCLCVTNNSATADKTICKTVPIITPAANFYHPSFFMTASYDWMHNFYDNNIENDNSYTDSDTDNFNRIITVDSNLFPIYTAMKGDQDFPNIAMRNWSSDAASPWGGNGISPSKNDYMNRSVAAVGNYLNYTSYLYYGYGSVQAVKAVGLRTYMEWVYALDPANNNFRRYKFIKMADDVVPPLNEDGGLYGDVLPLDPSSTDKDVFNCTTCDACHWYQGSALDMFCSATAASKSPCCQTLTNSSLACSINLPSGDTKDEIWAFSPKKPGASCGGTNGGSAAKYPFCNDLLGGSGAIKYGKMDATAQAKLLASTDPSKQGAPSLRYPVLVPITDINSTSGTTVKVKFYFEGHQFSSVAGLAFILNKGGGSCEQTWVVSSNGNFDGTWQPSDPNGNVWNPSNIIFDPANPTSHGQGLAPGAYQPGGAASVKCEECRGRPYIYFDVPKSCLNNMLPGSAEYKYIMVDVFTCDQASWAIRVPKIPQSVKDQAFRIPVTPMDGGTLNGKTWAQMTDAEKAAAIEKRWTNLDGYLDTVPPRSYPGYTSYNSGKWAPGYGSKSNRNFRNATSVRFKDPRDIDAYRDYFDIKNGAPVYIFVADTGNSRIQVFTNTTGVAGDVGANAPIRPVPVKGPNAAKANTNEIGFRAFPNMTGGDGRRGDWRNYTTLSGASFQPYTAGKGEFYFPHGVAVDQDPDSRDVYLFVADTYNHRIQVFRDISGVSSQPMNNKNFDFKLAAMWGTYPMQNMTSMKVMTQPGAYNFRYPKGIDIARFKNNSSFLYVVDSKNYRVMRYLVGEDPAALDANGKVTNSGTGIPSNGIKADAGFGYDASKGAFSRRIASVMGQPMLQSSANPGFLNPQDVATGYTGFYRYTAPFGKGTRFLNNYMVYVTDSSRNNDSIDPKLVSTRVMQFIDVPEGFSSITGAWIPWETTRNTKFSTYTAARMKEGTAAAKYHNLKLGQNPFGLKGPNAFQLYSGGVYQSKGQWDGAALVGGGDALGSTNNAGQAGYFTDRPFGIAALHWNTMKPIDIRVVDWSNPAESADLTATAWRSGEKLPRSTALRIGVSSRYMSFGLPFDKRAGFKNSSTTANQIAGAWDAQFAGRVHIFCYDGSGKFTNYTALYPQMAARREAPYNEAYRPSYLLPTGLAGIPGTNGCPGKGLVKIVAEDKDFPYSGRTGTVFYGIQ